MRAHTKTTERPPLDHAKLLGFRNLIAVMGCDDDLRQKSELAFNKQGTETTLRGRSETIFNKKGVENVA